MYKTHVRSYSIAQHGDVEVVDRRGREALNLSSHYEGAPRDRAELRLGASLDVFRLTDGQLVWSASANGHDNGSASSLALLLQLYLEDVSGTSGAPRSF